MSDAELADAIGRMMDSGLSIDHLVDMYGADGGEPANAEELVFRAVSSITLAAIREMGWKSRSGTHARMADAILHELALASSCRCDGGRLRSGPVCPRCHGSGRKPASITWRARMCECHYVDFRDRLLKLYRSVYAHVAQMVPGE